MMLPQVSPQLRMRYLLWQAGLLLVASAIAPIGVPYPARAEEFQLLGTIRDNSQTSTNSPSAMAVSADGSVAVGFSQEEAFRWTQNDRMVGLGFLNFPPGFTRNSSRAYGSNSNGTVIVGSGLNPLGNGLEAFRWTQSGGMVSLGTLPGGVFSGASAVNSDGSVVVGISNTVTDPSVPGQAYRWTKAGGMIGLGVLAGDNWSEATGVSSDGLVVVGRSGLNLTPASPIFTTQAFRWTQSGGMVGLGFLPGGSESIAYATNSTGSVVVGHSKTQTAAAEAFRWTQTAGVVGLGFLPGDAISSARAVNFDGSVVVGWSHNGLHTERAVRWTDATGIQSIQDILSANGIFSGHLGRATGVSADGTVIVGGQGQPWIARIPVNAFALLDLRGADHSIGSLVWGGLVTNSGPGTATLTIGHDNADTVFKGSIQDGRGVSALVKVGSGLQTLSGISSYSGTTIVRDGTLSVTGDISSSRGVIVRSGATLAGTGVLPDVTVANGGTLSPGNPIGSIAVKGKLTFNEGATYFINVSPTGAGGTNVSGAAALAGAVQAAFSFGSYATKQYSILNAASVTGRFDGLTTINLPANFKANLSYTDTDALLDLTAVLPVGGADLKGHGLNGNQSNVAATLNNFFNNGGELPPGFISLFGLTGDALRNALNQASGEPGATVSISTFMAWNSFFNMMFDPFAQNRGGFGGGFNNGASAFAATAGAPSEAVSLAYAAVTPKGDLKSVLVTKAPGPGKSGNRVSGVPAPAPADSFASRWSIWGGGYGGSATTDGNAQTGSHNTTSRAYGFAIGADHRLAPETIIGFALAGGGTSFGLDQGLGGGSSDLFQASVYARQNWGAAYLMAAFGYGWQDVTLNRTVTIAGPDKLEADFNAHSLAGRAEGGYRFGGGWSGVTPYAALQVVSLDLPGFSERATSGANTFALSYAGRTDTQTRTELGARFDHALPLQDALLTLRGRAAWSHDFDTDRIANPTFLALPGAAFTVNGARPDADSLLVSAGAELGFCNGFSIAGSFEGEFSGNTQSYAGKGALRYRW